MDALSLNQSLNSSIDSIASTLNLTKPQFIKLSSDLAAVPALIVFFVLTHALFLIVGCSLVEKKKKFLTIWFITLVLSGIVLLVLVYEPNVTQTVLSYLR